MAIVIEDFSVVFNLVTLVLLLVTVFNNIVFAFGQAGGPLRFLIIFHNLQLVAFVIEAQLVAIGPLIWLESEF